MANSSPIGRLLGEFRAAFRKDLRVYFRYPSWIASEFITLPAWFVLFAVGVASWAPRGGVTATFRSSTVFSFFYWGFIFLIVFSTSIWGIGQSIRTEQLQGTIEQLFMAPVSRVTLIFGRFARTFFTDLAIIAYTTVLLSYFSKETIVVQNPLALIAAFAVLELGVLGFGLIFAAITFRVKSFNILANLAQFAVIGLCGVFFPLDVLRSISSGLYYVSLAIPFTYFQDIFRYAAVGGDTIFGNAAVEFPIAGVLAVGLFLVGLFFFTATEKSAQKRGSLGTH